jgi:hypothetical protein
VINIAMSWSNVDSAFIRNAATPDSTLNFVDNPPVYTSLVSEVFKCMNIVIADGILVRVSPSNQHGAQCLTWAQGLAMLGCLGALVEGHLFACRDDYW